MNTCEIRDCENTAYHTMGGIACCNRCTREFTSIGMGAVYFNGRWHGVKGARYTAEQIEVCPGIDGGRGPTHDDGAGDEPGKGVREMIEISDRIIDALKRGETLAIVQQLDGQWIPGTARIGRPVLGRSSHYDGVAATAPAWWANRVLICLATGDEPGKDK